MEEKYYRVNKINNDLAVAHPNIAGFSCTIPGRIGIWKYCLLRKGKHRRSRTITCQSREETNNKVNPHMASTQGIEMLSPDHCTFPYSLIYRENFVDLLKEKRLYRVLAIFMLILSGNRKRFSYEQWSSLNSYIFSPPIDTCILRFVH